MVRDDLRSTGIRETDVFPVVLGGMDDEDGVRSLVGDVFGEGGLMQDGLIIGMFAGGVMEQLEEDAKEMEHDSDLHAE